MLCRLIEFNAMAASRHFEGRDPRACTQISSQFNSIYRNASMSMGEGSNESLEEEISSLPEWDSLPLPCLVQIFDDLLRAPTPHPSYLSGKLKVIMSHVAWRI